MRTAVITGGTGTLGRAIAGALAADGLRVVLVGRDRARGAAAVDTLRAAGAEAAFVALDVRDPGWPLATGEPSPDVVVHGAAAYAPYSRVEAVTDEDWREVFAVGPDAALRAARHWMPGMRARGHGRLVWIGSVSASTGGYGQAPYTAAKAALTGLARTLALEGGRDGVTCNVVEVGLLEHPRTRAMRPEVVESLVSRAAVPRLGTPDEVASVVAFLARPGAGWISGAVWPVSGGLGLRLG